jgi:hypothetical protein
MGVARSPMRRWIAAALVLAGMGAASATAPARVAIDSEVTIRFVQRGPVESLRGRVLSPVPACEPRRKVAVYGDDGATKKVEYMYVGNDRTDVNGRWFVTTDDGGPVDEGHYFAKVRRKRILKGRCRADRSRTVRVGKSF